MKIIFKCEKLYFNNNIVKCLLIIHAKGYTILRILLLLILLIYVNILASPLTEANEAYQKNNIQKAIKLYKKSAREGEDEAYFKLGIIHYSGQFIKKDLEKAMQYFQQAAQYNHIKAKYNTALIYSQKKYKKHNYKKAYNLFLDLAQQNHPKAQYMLANALIKGLGTHKDYKEALKWLERSYFENKYEPSRCMLAVVYANGYGVLQNFGRASVLARKGYEEKRPLCYKVYKEFNLHKHKIDRSFKFGYYKDLN
jgi:hypothetical protein